MAKLQRRRVITPDEHKRQSWKLRMKKNIPPFSRSLFKNRYQIVVANAGIRYEELQLLKEAAVKRRQELSCLLCDANLLFANPRCAACGVVTDFVCYMNPDGTSMLVMPYLLDADMTDSLLQKAMSLGDVYRCLSCKRSLQRDGLCHFCDCKTYYLRIEESVLIPALDLREHYIRPPNEVALRLIGTDIQGEALLPAPVIEEPVISPEERLRLQRGHIEVRQQILDYLADGEVRTTQEIHKAVSGSKKSVHLELNKLKGRKIQKLRHGHYRIMGVDE